MALPTITFGDAPWPVGTSVGAYPVASWPGSPPFYGQPPASAITPAAQGVVGSSSTCAITGLEPGTPYYCGAPDSTLIWLWVNAFASGTPQAPGGGEGGFDTGDQEAQERAEANSIPRAEKGKPFGTAELDAAGLIPESELAIRGVTREEVEAIASPLAPDFPGFTVELNGEGVPELHVVSRWGLHGTEAYYDPAGALDGEGAVMSIDQTTGDPVLTLIKGTSL